MGKITAAITAVQGYVPEHILSNEDLAKLVELLTDWGKLGKVFTGSVYSSILKPGA